VVVAVAAVESTGVLDCSFDEDDFCGYQDVSEAPVKWVRSKTHDLLSPGKNAFPGFNQVNELVSWWVSELVGGRAIE